MGNVEVMISLIKNSQSMILIDLSLKDTEGPKVHYMNPKVDDVIDSNWCRT
jgi:hypothetical protein